MTDKLVLDNGKYTVINELGNGGGFKALRYGEEWRNLAGDNLILHMYYVIEEQKAEIESLQKYSELLSCLEACGVDNWSGYSDAHEMMAEEESE